MGYFYGPVDHALLIDQTTNRFSWRLTRRTPLTAPLAVLYGRRADGGRVEWF